MAQPNHFVNDGNERTCAAQEPEIRAAVVAEYAAQFAALGWWGRMELKWRIAREIKRRIARQAPPDALY